MSGAVCWRHRLPVSVGQWVCMARRVGQCAGGVGVNMKRPRCLGVLTDGAVEARQDSPTKPSGPGWRAASKGYAPAGLAQHGFMPSRALCIVSIFSGLFVSLPKLQAGQYSKAPCAPQPEAGELVPLSTKHVLYQTVV